MSFIDIHADDFAVSFHASEDIIALCKQGVLDSISIIPNMSCYEKSITLLRKEQQNFPHEILKSVHLNFMEGHCVADVSQVPHLVDGNGFFSVTWGSLLLASYNPFKRQIIQNELTIEIKAQIHKVLSSGIISGAVRLDSHQHPHHIPVVCNALRDAIHSDEFKTTFVRNSREPISVYLKHPNVLLSCSAINGIKCILLNMLSHHLMHSLNHDNLAKGYLCGVLFSGCMNERLSLIATDLYTFSERKKETVEILFHPGSVYKNEINAEYCKAGFVSFHLSQNRNIEYKTICSLYTKLKFGK